MLDIKLIRENPEKVKDALAKRKAEDRVDEVLRLDQERRDILYRTEQLKSQQNTVSKQIPQLKKEGKDVAPIFAEMKKLSDEIKELVFE